MRFNTIKSCLITSGLAASALLLGSGTAFAQQVSLTAAATTTTMPDGSIVPMCGYNRSAAAVAPATCANLNTSATAGTGSPMVIYRTGRCPDDQPDQQPAGVGARDVAGDRRPVGRRTRNDGVFRAESGSRHAERHMAHRQQWSHQYAATAREPRPVVLHTGGPR